MNSIETPTAFQVPAIDCVIEGSLMISHLGSILFASSGATCLLGYSEKELLALPDSQQLVYGPDRFIYAMWLSETRNSNEKNSRGLEMRMLHQDNTPKAFLCTFRKAGSGSNICLNFRSIDSEATAGRDRQLLTLNEYAREINQAIRKQNTPDNIVSQAVTAISASGFFDTAWISPVEAENTNPALWPSLSVSGSSDFNDKNGIVLNLQSQAIAGGKSFIDHTLPQIVFSNDTFSDKTGSLAAIPIFVNSTIYALLNLYQAQPHFFTDKFLKVCESIAGDISYALELETSRRANNGNEQKLRSSEVRLKHSHSVGGTGNFEIDFRTGNAVWSEEALRIYGLPMEEKAQSYENWLSYVHPEDLETVKKLPFGKADPYDTMFSYRIVRRDGSVRHVAIHYEYEFNEKGRVSSLFGTIHDITDMKAAESALLQSERNLRHIVDSIPQLIYGLDEKGIFIFVNKSFAFFYGKKPADIIGKAVTDIVSNLSESQALLDRDGRIMTTGRSGTHELELTNNKNERRIFTTIRVPYARTAKGQKAILGVAYDISNQKKSDSERTLMINDIGRRNRDLEQFSYIVSHNLRSPVANIIGLVGELRDDGYNRKTKELMMDKLLYSVQLLDQIIIDLNTILEIKGNNSEKKEMVLFNEVTDNIRIAIMDIITAEEVEIRTHYETAAGIYTLKGYLYSIFQNLISNSIKYRRADATPLIDIRTQKTEQSIIITYADNGLGIDLKKRGHDVFGLYKRFHNHKPGRGLGLFMVKTQVEAMGGIINIGSQPGVGTIFTITFPI